MTILATSAIEAALRDGSIVCEPRPAVIQGAHIDVTLGKHYWLMRKPTSTILDLKDADPRHWFELKDASAWNGYVVIPPRTFALCHTEEFVGSTVGDIVPMLDTRSTPARWGGLAVHAGAGAGDPFYHSRWTLEIWNHNSFAVSLPVGARVGNLSFHHCEGTAAGYEGRYNAGPEAWTAESMLPRQGNW